MSDWEIEDHPGKLEPRYISFDIHKKSNEKWPPELHVTITDSYSRGEKPELKMRVSSALMGSGFLGEDSLELQQFTAYVNIHKHAALFTGWVNTVYKDLAHKVWDLTLAIDHLDDQIKDPYTAWVESKK